MKLRIYSLMTALFFLGMVSGVFISLSIAKSKIRDITSSPTNAINEQLLSVLDHKLRLTPDQEDAVKTVLKEAEAEVLPLRKEFRGRALAMIQTYRPKVAEHLDDSQKDELDSLVTKLLKTWQLDGDPDQ